MPHPIAAGNAWKGETVKGGACAIAWDSEAALDRPVLEGYMIGSDEASVSVRAWPVPSAAGRLELALCDGGA